MPSHKMLSGLITGAALHIMAQPAFAQTQTVPPPDVNRCHGQIDIFAHFLDDVECDPQGGLKAKFKACQWVMQFDNKNVLRQHGEVSEYALDEQTIYYNKRGVGNPELNALFGPAFRARQVQEYDRALKALRNPDSQKTCPAPALS